MPDAMPETLRTRAANVAHDLSLREEPGWSKDDPGVDLAAHAADACRPRRATADEPVWLFDLDNTLHDAASEVFPRIRDAMAEFIARELSLDLRAAEDLRTDFWQRHGATLPGLVEQYGIDADRFLHETHAFPELWRLVPRDPRLVHALRRLPGRRIVCTNAPREYAQHVVRRLGIAPWIDAIIPIESMRFAGRYQPKPSRSMLRRVVAWLQVSAARCILVEDTPANLAAARALGMRTILVRGTTGRPFRPAHRLRAGSSRHIGLQVQSVAQLPRKAVRGETSSRTDAVSRPE